MADQPEQTPNIYALLIGIDGYNPNRLYKNLKGAVRDINLVASYLLETLKIPSERVFKLTSPNPEVAETIETKDPEPTYENIVAKFNAITEIAQPGEQVYIYYSGHGGRATTIYPELKGADQNDEGIVPMDVGDREGRYLRDVELTTLLKRMTDKGLIVTVILDSCHSGGTTRGDAAIRGGPETDTAQRDSESLVASRQELIENWQAVTGEGRDIAWLPPSNNYVLLAACRPHEYAYEYAFDGKERHGALTYWLIQTLATSSTGLSFRTLYDRVCAQIQSKFPQQLPMLVGDGTRAVFGNKNLPHHYSVTVSSVDSNQEQVTLNAGLAQGLSRGTQFAIYPLKTTDFSNRQQQQAIVEIAEVQASKSVANLVLDSKEEGIKVIKKIEPGAPAVMVSAPVDLVRRVLLLDNKEAGDKEHQLPAELVDKQTGALEKVRQALAENGWVVEVQAGDEQKSHYQVAVGRDGEYEISSENPLKNLGTPLQIDAPKAAIGVVKRLVHLAKYQAVQSLDNPSSQLVKYLEIELVDQNNKTFSDPSNIVLEEGQSVSLRVKNTLSQPLNIAVLDLDATWAISQYPIKGIESIFYPLESQEEIYLPMEPELPEGEGYKQAKETLKLFATRGLANFQWLTLPALDEDLGQRGNLDEELEREAKKRGLGINPLNKLLGNIGADVENPPETRRMRPKSDPNAEWLTKHVTFTIINPHSPSESEQDVEGKGVERGGDIPKSPSTPTNQKQEHSHYKDIVQLQEQLEQVYRIQEPPQQPTITNKDLVDCSVFSPPAVACGEMFLVQVFVHLPEQAKIAKQHAELFDSDAKQLGVRSLGIPTERGTELTFYLSIPQLEMDDSIQQLIWNGKADSVQFGVTVPPNLTQKTVIGTVTVSQNSIPIGHLKFKLSITPPASSNSTEPQPIGEAAHLYKKAFVSYSSKDRNEVLKRVQGLAVTGIEVFQDVLNLEPGDRWEKELYRHIDECDLFLLFWSTAAKESKWVLKEALYALERQGKDGLHPPEIIPVIIEGPPLVSPPDELQHLHFNDKLLYLIAMSK